MALSDFGDYGSLSQLKIAALLALVGCTGSILWWRKVGLRAKRTHKRKAQLPSPPKFLPTWFGKFGGHTLLVDKTRVADQYEGWVNEFGGGPVEIFVFGNRRILVVDPVEARRMLQLRPSAFGRGIGEVFQWAAKVVGASPFLFTDEGAAWGRSRRLVAPPLSGHNVQAMVPAVVKVAETLMAKWATAADDGKVVDAKDDLKRFAHDTISLVGFRHESRTVAAKDRELCPTFVANTNTMGNVSSLLWDPMNWIAWALDLPTPFLSKIKKEKRDVQAIIKRLIENEKHLMAVESDGGGVAPPKGVGEGHHAADSSTRPESTTGAPTPAVARASEGLLLRKLVGAADPRKGSTARMAMSEDEITTHARGLFVAGQDTTGLSLAWCMYFLAKRPDVLARCRAEALQNLSSRDGVVKDFEEGNSLTYIGAVFKETQRLRPVAPINSISCKEEYTMRNGHSFPAGTDFVVMSRYMSTREKYFTRAKEFVPERWIDAEREKALLGPKTASAAADSADAGRPRECNHVTEAYLPFGAGPRVCPGYDMANLEARIVLATLSVRFDLALAPGQADPPKNWQALACGPKDLKVVLTKRPIA